MATKLFDPDKIHFVKEAYAEMVLEKPEEENGS